MATIDRKHCAQYTPLQADTIADHDGVYMAPFDKDPVYMYPSAVCDGDKRQANENLYGNKAKGCGKQKSEQKSKKIYCLCAFLIASIIFNLVLISLVIMFGTHAGLSSNQEVSPQSQNALSNLEEATGNITTSLKAIMNSLSQFKDYSILKFRELIHLSSNTYKSCADVLSLQPDSPSGYYSINNEARYCEMGELCGSEGGWTRLAYLDMKNASINCPEGLRLYEENLNNTRACGRPLSGIPSCASLQFPSNGVRHSEVCGRVVGYQYATPDAVSRRKVNGSDINCPYVDGVSITRGNPRQHVWTLMAGAVGASCPCSIRGYPRPVEAFIGNDYFCESGNPSVSNTKMFYPNDPLWDGDGCGQQEGDCCAAPGLPWFHKTLSSTTTDYLELRICGDQDTWDEDVAVGFYDIYVK